VRVRAVALEMVIQGATVVGAAQAKAVGSSSKANQDPQN